MLAGLDFSARGWGRVALWTVFFGTLGCIAAAMLLDLLSFELLSDAERLRSIATDLLRADRYRRPVHLLLR